MQTLNTFNASSFVEQNTNNSNRFSFFRHFMEHCLLFCFALFSYSMRRNRIIYHILLIIKDHFICFITEEIEHLFSLLTSFLQMDSIITNEETPSVTEENKTDSIPALQINPPSMMTSLSTFKPVDDRQENVLESTYGNRSQSTDPPVSSLETIDLTNTQKVLPTMNTDNNSVAAWLKATVHESLTPPIERSPSLPATIIEQITTRSRRESTVSTLCDQQQQQQQQQAASSSNPSDTMSSTISQHASSSTEYQRSFSFPFVDQHQPRDNDTTLLFQEQKEDDLTSEFLPAQESEDSEVEKKTKEFSPSDEQQLFTMRSPAEESRKTSPIVSFHATVSFESHRKPGYHRQRHNSWNKQHSNKSSSHHRFPFHKIHSQINPKTLQTSTSVPKDHKLLSVNRTPQSSSISDNVFLSTSPTNSPSSTHHLQLINDGPLCSQFLSIPSSTSRISSDQLTSNISDASGQSGIESTNLRTSISEAPMTSSLIEEETNDDDDLFFSKHRASSVSSGSSRTASTESLPTSSSEDETNNFQKKLRTLNKMTKPPQTPQDQRLDVLTRLGWLLEKRPTLNPQRNLAHRKHLPGPTTV